MSSTAASASAGAAGTFAPAQRTAPAARSTAAGAAVETAAHGASAALATEELTVRYGRHTAVDGVSLALGEGTVYALLGRNGAGKSSLVRCLLGQQRPDGGRALLFGRDAWRERAGLMAEVGVVPEQPDAPPGASARRLARFCRPLYRHWDSSGFEERLRRFDVPSELPFGRLSKGQQRHVALALALAGRPRLLILDDPTLGLDAVARRAFFEELIGELADRGTTIFLTTHELAAVERIAERVGILAGGRLLLDEDLERLKQRFRRIWMPGAALDAAAAAAADQALGGFAPLRRVRRDWGAEVVVTAYDDERFQSMRGGPVGDTAEVASLTLEEIFVALVGNADSQAAASGSGGDAK